MLNSNIYFFNLDDFHNIYLWQTMGYSEKAELVSEIHLFVMGMYTYRKCQNK